MEFLELNLLSVIKFGLIKSFLLISFTDFQNTSWRMLYHVGYFWMATAYIVWLIISFISCLFNLILISFINGINTISSIGNSNYSRNQVSSSYKYMYISVI